MSSRRRGGPAPARSLTRRRVPRARGAVRAVGVLFSCIGGIILLFGTYELVGTTAITKRHQSALRREFATAPLQSAAPSPGATRAPAPVRPRTGAPIARLRIPKIGVDVIVVEGVSRASLAKGPGHYPGTSPIGAPGPTGIAGHRTGWGAPFLDLNELQPGDRIVLETREATFAYAVTDKQIVKPGDVWVLEGDPRSAAEHRLTLTTCTPKFTARDRLVVWADLVETKPAA